MSSNPWLYELEKLANSLEYSEEMNPNMQPAATEDEVSAMQADTEAQELPEEQALTEEELAIQEQIEAERAEAQMAEEQAMQEQELQQREMAVQQQSEELAMQEQNLQQQAEELAMKEQAIQQAIAEQQESDAQMHAEQQDAAQETLLGQQAKSDEAAVDQIGHHEPAAEEVMDEISDDDTGELLATKLASEMQSLGTLAKIIDHASGVDTTDALHKEATELIDYMVSSEEAFHEGMERVASNLFENEENLSDLYSKAGLEYTLAKLAELDAVGFDKQADEEMGALQKLKAFAGEAIDSARGKIEEGFHSVRNIGQIGEELADVSGQLEQHYESLKTNPVPMIDESALKDMRQKAVMLERQKNIGNAIVRGGAGAAIAGGALYGGKKLYDHLHQEDEEKVAGVLPVAYHDGTLKTATETEPNGGIQKMSKELVHDFLKVAGAAGLIEIMNDESRDIELRKEASEAFDEIAAQGRTEMGESFAKVAQNIYNEQELHEIVAGEHNDFMFDKIANVLSYNEMSSGELEKVAGAGSVAAKGVAGALTDSKANIEATIKQEKEEAEGAGREHSGEITNNGTGEAGGKGVGELSGYGVINNPAKYNVDKTASELQEAYLLKEAAMDAFASADKFIRENEGK